MLMKVDVSLGADFLAARQPSSRQSAECCHRDSLVDAVRNHLALFFAVQQVVLALHVHELGPAVETCHMIHLLELPGEHRRRA